MKNLWPNILYPLGFILIVLFLAFHNNKIHKTHIKDGFYKIEGKVLKNNEVKIISPEYLKDDVIKLNIKLPEDSYIRGYIKVKNGVVKTSKDLLEIAYNKSSKTSLKEALKNRFKKTTDNDWSKDIGLALLFGEGSKALPEDLLTSFSVNSLIFLLIMSGIHMDMIFRSLSNMLFGEHKEVFALVLLLLYVGIFMEHGAPIIRAVSYLAVGVLLKALYRYINPIKQFFVSGIMSLLFNISFYKSVGFWLSMVITFYILIYLKNIEIPKSFAGKIILSSELSFVAILSSMFIVSKLGPVSFLAVFVVPFLLMVVEIYLVLGLLNILTMFSLPVLYIPLNKIAYYFGDFVYNINLEPMFFKIPLYYGILFDIVLFGQLF